MKDLTGPAIIAGSFIGIFLPRTGFFVMLLLLCGTVAAGSFN